MEEKNVDMNSVNLLVSILLCYPAIGTVSFDPKDNTLRLVFMMQKFSLPQELQKFVALLQESIRSYLYLQGKSADILSVTTDLQGNIIFMNVNRDIATLSQGEIKLICELVNNHFGAVLVREQGSESEGEPPVQEELIDGILSNIKLGSCTERMMGIREEGRVMVFNMLGQEKTAHV